MSNFYISSFGRSNVGKKRGNNEDNFYLSGVTVDSAPDITARSNKSTELAVAVFDGMGGEAAGEKASQSTAVTYGQRVSGIIDSCFSAGVLQETIAAANAKVCAEIKSIGKRMGCTFVSLGFKEDKFYVANVGDSRAYLFRDNIITCVSKDHTVAQTMVDAGLVSYEDSQRSKEKHKLTQHIGIFPDEMIIEPFFTEFEAVENDIMILCSDGLTDMLTDNEIAGIVALGGSEEQITNNLVEAALERGGKDNVTVIVSRVSGGVVSVPAVAPRKGLNGKGIGIICGAVGLVALIIVLVLVFGGNDDSSRDNDGKSDDKGKPSVTLTETDSSFGDKNESSDEETENVYSEGILSDGHEGERPFGESAETEVESEESEEKTDVEDDAEDKFTDAPAEKFSDDSEEKPELDSELKSDVLNG